MKVSEIVSKLHLKLSSKEVKDDDETYQNDQQPGDDDNQDYQQQDDETSTVTSATDDSAFDPAYFGFENLDLHNNNDEKDTPVK